MATRILTVCDHCGTVLEPSVGGPCGRCGGWEWRYVATTGERTPLRLLPAWVARSPASKSGFRSVMRNATLGSPPGVLGR
jgi:hypothetical protein